MEAWVTAQLAALAATFSLPGVGLVTVFFVSLLSATLLPMASVPAVWGLIELNPDLYWPAIAVATAGNTAGGAISWWMGYGAEAAAERFVRYDPDRYRPLVWLRRFGAKACLLSWLPFVGDPLCALAGWLKLPFWPCVFWMAVGKFLRYVTYIVALQWGVAGLVG
jgi:membrane protein YqaA with SNARE-associated domain